MPESYVGNTKGLRATLKQQNPGTVQMCQSGSGCSSHPGQQDVATKGEAWTRHSFKQHCDFSVDMMSEFYTDLPLKTLNP